MYVRVMVKHSYNLLRLFINAMSKDVRIKTYFYVLGHATELMEVINENFKSMLCISCQHN